MYSERSLASPRSGVDANNVHAQLGLPCVPGQAYAFK